MADTDCVLHKQYMKMSAFDIRRVWGVKEERGHYFTWLIENLKNLEKNVEYNVIEDKINWIFGIIKRQESYDLKIYTAGYHREIVCSIIYCQDWFSSEIMADIVSPGIQTVNLPNDILNVPENTFLQVDSLALILKFNKVCEILKPTLCPKDIEDTYTYECVQKVLDSASEDSSHKDFFIYVGDEKLLAHKAILVARSSFFRKFIEKNCADKQIGKITINAPYDAVYAVLSFIYTGHLLIKSSDNLVQILAVAERFGITRLKTFMKKYIHNVVIKCRKTPRYSKRQLNEEE